MSAGKGSAPRPFSVPRDQYERAHESIFGKRERQQYVPPPLSGIEQSKAEIAEGFSTLLENKPAPTMAKGISRFVTPPFPKPVDAKHDKAQNG